MRIVMARISEKGLALPRRVAIEAVPAVAVCSAAAVGCGRWDRLLLALLLLLLLLLLRFGSRLGNLCQPR
jgi:hypothetical protein